ncbi:hypothetical protein Vi05172_g9376 [Venturia inaequalis]|nr:hypothetical protein Vi05172_g9376 [Venturia inaequalis]
MLAPPATVDVGIGVIDLTVDPESYISCKIVARGFNVVS